VSSRDIRFIDEHRHELRRTHLYAAPVNGERDTNESRFARVLVQGASGSGKTTLSAALAAARGVECLELDGLYHQPNWTPLEVEEFRGKVASFASQPGWVVDGNYSQVRDLLWPRATTIALIDLPRRVVMSRVIKRTVLRIVKRERLWNDNRESWRNALSPDPMRNIVVWSWKSHSKYHEIVPREARASVGPDRVVVLSRARDVRRFFEEASRVE
jgi:adenylate kinase family enzyme